MIKIFIYGMLGLVLLVAGMLMRTVRLTSKQVRVDPAAVIEVDGLKIASNLANALKFRTISRQDPARFQAEAFLALHAYLEDTFPGVHAALTREVVADYSLLYTWKGQKQDLEPILLMAHLDVVPVEPGTEDDWTYPAFAGRIAEGFVWGRGAMDFKVAVTGILEAVELLLGQGFQPRRTIYFAFGHDEEIGGKNGAARVAALLGSRGVKPAFVLDEGLSITEGIVPEIIKPVAFIGIAEKGYLSLELTVETEGGHSSMPSKETAIGILSTAIHRLERNPFPAKFEGPARRMFEYLAPEMSFPMRFASANLWLLQGLVKRQFSAKPSSNAVIRTTTAPTIFDAGVKENVLPMKARAVVNFRILNGNNISGVIDHVRQTVDDSRVQVKPIGKIQSEPSPVSDMHSSGFDILQRTIRQVFPGMIVAPGTVIGATDSRHYVNLSRNIYRFSPIWIGPDDIRRIHGTNERISINNYEQIVRFYYQLIRNSESDLEMAE